MGSSFHNLYNLLCNQDTFHNYSQPFRFGLVRHKNILKPYTSNSLALQRDFFLRTNGIFHIMSLFLPAATKLGQGNIFTSICLSTGGGRGVCLSACWNTPPPRDQTPPGADTPPWDQTSPREQTPPGADTPPGAALPRQALDDMRCKIYSPCGYFGTLFIVLTRT